MYYENLQVPMNTKTGQGKNFEIHLPSGQVSFSFHLPLVKYYLPEENALPYHL